MAFLEALNGMASRSQGVVFTHHADLAERLRSCMRCFSSSLRYAASPLLEVEHR
ncbi:hypothetical protein [Nocardiopsis alba]|uniref:hypothetical protein n=1 Tax=Nocardiopsis alba TaxID=53437 RepID=UPI000345F66F|nr:hypothetical protein [Nocardiopsis alba]